MKLSFGGILCAIWLCAAMGFASAPVAYPSGRHILLLEADPNILRGIYYYGVIHEGGQPEELTWPLILPKEVTDFKPKDGLVLSDIITDAQGQLLVRKAFHPGMNLLGMDFQTPVLTDGSVTLTVQAPFDFKELAIAWPSLSQLQVHAEDFYEGLPHMLQGGSYKGLVSTKAIKKGDVLIIHVSGLPVGRGPFLWIGLALGVGMILAMVAYGLRRAYSLHRA